MGNFHFTIDGSHLIDGLDLRGETSVDAKDFVVNERPQWEEVKSLIEVLPGSRAAVLLDNFVIEAIDGCDLSGLMVAPEKQDVFGVLDLETEQQLDGFD